MPGPQHQDLTGLQFGRLTVLGEHEGRYDRRRRTHFWLCACECGESSVVSTDNLTRGAVQSCGCLAREATRSGVRQELVGYSRVHSRLRQEFGPARDFCCQECGRFPADQWSYDGKDPLELAETRQTLRGLSILWYSMRPAHYEPRCLSCHRRRDRVQRAREEERFEAFCERQLAILEQAEAVRLADELLDKYAPVSA